MIDEDPTESTGDAPAPLENEAREAERAAQAVGRGWKTADPGGPFRTDVEVFTVRPPAFDEADRPPPLLVGVHGIGMDGPSYAGLLEDALDLPAVFAFPDGPLAFQVEGEEEPRPGRAWYGYDGNQERFRAALDKGAEFLAAVTRRLVREHGTDPGRTVLMGYSMGAYLAGYAAFRNPDLYGGLVLQSGRLKWEFLEDEMAAAGDLQVLVQHGRRDRNVLPEAAEGTLAACRAAGVEADVAWHDGRHGITPPVARDLRSWLASHWSVRG